MGPRTLLILTILLSTACASAPVAVAPAPVPDEEHWRSLDREYQWIETLRNATQAPDPTSPRADQIAAVLDSHRKLDPVVVPFMDRLETYLARTGDGRAAAIFAKEKIILGDEYMLVLSRYDRAIEMYQSILAVDPGNIDAKQRIAAAQQRLYIDNGAFDLVTTGMTEQEVQAKIGLPREDWIRQKLENYRVFAVWIYPKADGGAAAVYFDNGVVYHKNWEATESRK